jgi:FtsZ-interacting cell division protein ZipA
MPQLRWTLLCLGVVFIILLAWIERRRQRRQGFTDSATVEKDPAHGSSGSDSGLPSMFREPALTLPEMRAAREAPNPTQDLPVVEIEDDSLNARRVEVGEPLRDPPTLSLPVVESGPEVARRRSEPTVSDFDSVQLPRTDDLQIPRLDTPASKAATPVPKHEMQAPRAGASDSEERAFNDAVFGDSAPAAEVSPPTVAEPDEQHTRTDVLSKSGPTFQGQSEPPSRTQFLGGAAAPEAPAAPRYTPADVAPIAEPIVDWPPDDQRKVVALRLVASPPERFAGRALRLALASEGFVLGKFQIFHKPDESGRAVLSAANLSKPGTFDVGTMDTQRYAGLSLFTVLPGARPPLKAFEDLLTTARNLNERLNGALQDERGGPLTPTRIATLRESLAGSETPS